jgi:hypothetical protein
MDGLRLFIPTNENKSINNGLKLSINKHLTKVREDVSDQMEQLVSTIAKPYLKLMIMVFLLVTLAR